jgi:hypothetical protein
MIAKISSNHDTESSIFGYHKNMKRYNSSVISKLQVKKKDTIRGLLAQSHDDYMRYIQTPLDISEISDTWTGMCMISEPIF